MDFEPGWAILAGVIGGGVMAAILYMGIFMLPNQMKMNLFMMLGSMMLPVGAAAFVMGAMVHAANSVVFGLIHGALYAAFDGQDGGAQHLIGIDVDHHLHEAAGLAQLAGPCRGWIVHG